MIFEGRNEKGDLELRAEVVIVGSGAGGAVMARELAEAGWDVLVLEEGGYVRPEEYGQFRPSETLRKMALEAGTTAALPLGDTPAIGIMAGRTVGGSSVLTGGVCFRLPDWVLETWTRDHQLEGYTHEGLEPAYASVEREVNVITVPEAARSRSTVLFGEGAAKLGAPLKPLRRNTSGCEGKALCNFGCPKNAKLSVDVTYLRKAQAHGARIYSDCRVDRVIARDGRAAGVVGRVLNGPGRTSGGKLTVHADTVVISAGTLHTPQILRRSGIGRRSRQLGRNLTVHPAFRVSAVFEEEVRGWEGAMQSAFSDHYEQEGITLVSAFAPLNVVAASTPGCGTKFQERLRQMGHLAMFGGLIHDEGVGRIWPSPFREPVVTYRMPAHDKAKMIRAISILSEAFLLAGAKEVLLPVFGSKPIRQLDDLKSIHLGIPGRYFECVSFHPLGSARMGNDPRGAVVSPDGQAFDLPGLYVADGSIFPSSIGVNSQLPIMTVATRIAWRLREQKRRKVAA
jgi:choline dehydrogenase-like flavoprotein